MSITVDENPAAHSEGTTPEHITRTEFFETVMNDVYGPRKGGAIIFIDAENARKGVAKTSCAVALARLFSAAFRYDLRYIDMTLSGTEYLQRYQEHPGQQQPSVLVLDEFVGAGAGDKRRSMSNQNVDFGRAWQLLRTKRVITLATLPDWNEADKRLKKLADYRIWCKEDPIGTFKPYKITVPFDADFGNNLKTKGMNRADSTKARRIQFPDMDKEGCKYYEYISERKDELIHSETWDADELAGGEDPEPTDPEEIRRQEAIKYAIRLYQPWDEDTDHTYREVAAALDEYSHNWVGERVREWKNGEHRNLVADPTEGSA